MSASSTVNGGRRHQPPMPSASHGLELLEGAERLVELYDAARVAASRAAVALTADTCHAVLASHAELDAACAEFAAEYFGPRARVVVGLWTVMVYRTRATRQPEAVLDLFDRYAAAEAVRG